MCTFRKHAYECRFPSSDRDDIFSGQPKEAEEAKKEKSWQPWLNCHLEPNVTEEADQTLIWSSLFSSLLVSFGDTNDLAGCLLVTYH